MVKFLIFILYIPIIFLFSHPYYLTVIFINLSTFALMAEEGKKVFHSVKFTVFLGVFIILINSIIINEGETILINWGFFILSLETVIQSLIYVFQLILVILVFSLINSLINPDKLMESFMKLKKIPQSILMLLLLSIRFFPLLMQDMNEIEDIQKTRGVEFDKGNLYKRIKNRVKIILPLLSTSLERSIQFSEALETKGFGLSKKRTLVFQDKMKIEEVLAVFVNIVLIIIFFVYFYLFDAGIYVIYPEISFPALTNVDIVVLLLTLILNFIIIHILYQIYGGDESK